MHCPPVDLPAAFGQSPYSMRQRQMSPAHSHLQAGERPPHPALADGRGTRHSLARQAAEERPWASRRPKWASDPRHSWKRTCTSQAASSSTPAGPVPRPVRPNRRSVGALWLTTLESSCCSCGPSRSVESPSELSPINGTFMAGLCLSQAATQSVVKATIALQSKIC